MIRVSFTPRFKRSYKKLPKHIRDDFDIKITLFMEDPNNPSLKTHKLMGKLRECLAFRLKNGFRVLFEYTDSRSVNLLAVGSHDIYKQF